MLCRDVDGLQVLLAPTAPADFAGGVSPLPDLTQISPRAIVAMPHAGILAVGFGQWAWYRALQLLPASAAAIGSLPVPVVGMFASAWLLDETVTWLEITALVLVLISLTMVLIGPAGLDAWRRWRAG